MIILFLGIICISVSFILYSYSFKVNALNRFLINVPNPLFESCIPLTVQEDEVELYFDKELVKLKYQSYVEKGIKNYVESYEINYYFYNTENGGFCDEKDCKGVEINIEANVMLGLTYKRVMDYQIVEGKLHG